MLKIGQRAPEFHLRNAAGGQLGLRELISSKPLIIFFIRSTTCTFCQGELSRLAQRYPEVIAADTSLAAIVCEAPSRSQDWYQEVRPPYPLLVDEDRAVAKHFGVYKTLGFDSFRMAQPSVFVIDRTGTVKFAHLVTEEDAPTALDGCLSVVRALSRPPERSASAEA
jgi:methyl-accepting chemotaxis protein